MDTHEAVERLRTAVLELVMTSPETALNVSSIASAAGISRDDYYRLAPAPIQLLAEALSDELLSQFDDIEGRYSDDEVRTLRARLALTHIAKWGAVYRGPLRVELMQSMRLTLAHSFRLWTEDYLRRHPEALPAGVGPDDNSAIEFLAAFVAGGGMAAIEVWVDDPEPDVDRAMKLLSAMAPSFV
ncbi:hypothetical protein [Leifsonia sp. AG29]|uniref:hypothetical protein n=1 Tax=Leifsonia sp. AG29 TaxID=2598860 RepID=UPI00131DA21E|nr:hypothetical protein [Leifsonia sp. AG29]